MVTNGQSGSEVLGGVVAGDLGPLAWVLDETRKSIDLATKSLKRYARDAEAARGVDLAAVDASQLRIARQHLHQVVGALDMVGQSVAAHMVRAMETAVQQYVLRPETCTEADAAKLEQAGFALVDYLDNQLSDKPRAALGLFPQYRQVLEMAGADRIHPADLWQHAWHWVDPATPSAAQRIAYGPDIRGRLDQRVLKIMKRGDVNAASELGVIALGLADGETARHPVIFWKLSAAFFEALAKSLVPMDVYVKRAASRILLQYTSLARGDQSVSERLAQDLLFFVAQARQTNASSEPVVTAVKRAWDLTDYQPVTYDEPAYGLYDPAVLAQARRRVESVKENWSALAGGDMARLKACVDQFGLVVESLNKLHANGKPMSDALTRVAQHIAHSAQPPSPELSMETATAVLFLEASFTDFQPADAVFTQRLTQLAERLDAVRMHQTAPALEPWMEELYRSFSDRQTMGTVIGELRTTLGETEQHLDQFFRHPDNKEVLNPVPSLLGQMKGVLSVLGLDQAALAVARMRDTVEGLLASEREVEPVADAAVFEKLGTNAGALGFLIDMMGYQPVLARRLFVFDGASGELRHVTGRERIGTPSVVAAASTVDLELDLADQEPSSGFDRLSELPAEALSGELEQLAAKAALDEKPALAQAAAHAADLARRQDADQLHDALESLSTISGVQQVAPLEAVAPTPDLGGDDDDDLLDIFLEEAREVVQNGQGAVAALRGSPADNEQLTTLRRAFHTLKGSSRMVGLTEFGEAAWSMEQLLNAWLAEQKPASDVLTSVADESLSGFGRWVDDIAGKRAGHWQAAPFTLVADALRQDGQHLPLVLPEENAAQAAGLSAEPADAPLLRDPEAVQDSEQADPSDEPGATPVVVEAASPSAEFDVLAAFDFPDLTLEPTVTVEAPPAEVEWPSQDALTEGAQPALAAPVDGPSQREVDGVTLDTDAPLGHSDLAGDEWAHEPGAPADGTAPSSGPVPTVEDQPLVGLELDELDFASLDSESVAATDTSGVDAGASAEPVALELSNAPGDPDHAQVLETQHGGIESIAEDALALDLGELDFAASDVEVSDAALSEFQTLQEGADDSEPTPAAESEEELFKQIGDLRISVPLYNVYLNEADEWSRHLITELSEWTMELNRPVPERAIARAHSLAGSSATVGFGALSELSRAVEHGLERLHGQPYGTAEQASVLNAAAEDIRRVLHQFAAGILKTPNADVLQRVQALEPTEGDAPLSGMTDLAPASTDGESLLPQTDGRVDRAAIVKPAFTAPDVSTPSIADDIDVVDAVDPDLFPIFEEEAEELMPQLSAAMREWLAHPAERGPRGQVLRALHTLKGSARLAGALRLGEMAHRTESAIETIGIDGIESHDIEPLLDHLDELQLAFKRLQAGDVGVEGEDVGGAIPGAEALASGLPEATIDATQASVATPAAPLAERTAPVRTGEVALPAPLSLVSARVAAGQSVRVRSQLLDRLVGQAGELMTSRARLESEVGQLRSSLSELTGNLERLRGQLRDVELQAETQMQSRLALSKDAQQNFDPLEFDRFTRMQELTRMMAESVNDVATVQRSFQRAIEASEDDLAAQARQSRELQRDLLRTRMVEFESISERLYRVVRQASKETGKQVRLDISGGSIEMDRGILDRMIPAFEHLLRNCVVHGIENQAMRTARSKDPTGLVVIEVQQAGNDVSVEFRDDGAGLNLPRIRERALQQGLISPEREMSDAEVGNLVFAPGFTTATEVTELAGRGVGMDVVRTEVQSLGGRIETSTRDGHGSSFRLVLPLTTAVTHVVMVRAGHLTVGVPSNLVEIVQRAPAKALEEAYRTGTYRYGEESVPFFWSGALLQSSQRSSEPRGRSTPVVIFRSAAQRVAVHVDEVLGNQEVVVKALGPQMSRLPGLVAITALASGAVALIYNPVALAAVYGEQAHAMTADAPAADAVATSDAPAAPTAATAATHSDIPLVLVVDDSITVRRVTQRLLQREGYRVALAADGLQGLERLQAERPAVVLSDIEMPRMDGFDFVRNIRADAALADLPVIMITSRIAEKHREHARELGVSHYLGKPYSEDELLGLIKGYTTVTAPAQ